MSDLIIISHGLRSDLPLLEEAELGFATDEEELYSGTLSGNVKLTSKSEITEINTILTEHAIKISNDEKNIATLQSSVGVDLENKLAEKVDDATLISYQTSVDNALNELIAKDDEIDAKLNSMTSSYIHDQIASSKTWTINHNLSKYPSVTIVDSAGTVVMGDIKYLNANSVVLTFSTEFSGKAFLN